jgi:hypothetical protein
MVLANQLDGNKYGRCLIVKNLYQWIGDLSAHPGQYFRLLEYHTHD